MPAPQVGIDVTAALTQGGGIGRYTRELVRALIALNADYNYTLYSAREPQHLPVPDPVPSGPQVTRRAAFLDERWLYRLWYRLRLPLPVQFFSGRLDLFHSPDFVLPPTSSGIPTLLTVHDLSFVHYPETFPLALVDYLNSVVPWSVKRATHILADSMATKMDLTDQWSVPEDKITVLYSGVSDAYRPEADDKELNRVRRENRLGDRPYILSVGTVQPRKNYQMLVRAFAPLTAEVPHLLAIAGGTGWMQDEIVSEAARLGIEDRVRFLGFVADDDLPTLYAGAALFVFPSLYEGFGLPVLEAMACGVPAIISNRSSLPEVGGASALQISPQAQGEWTEAMMTALQDSDLRQKMIAAGFEQADRFTWRRSAEQLQQVYAALLDKGPTSRHNYAT